MKKIVFVCCAAFSADCLAAADLTDSAKVLSSEPMYQTYTTQECHDETVVQPAQPRDRQMGGAILGGVAGGIIGAQVGKGNGSTAAAVAGAILGSVAGDRIQNNDSPQSAAVPRRVCRDVQKREISGYQVRYLYAGREISTVMSNPPGGTVRVEVRAVE